MKLETPCIGVVQAKPLLRSAKIVLPPPGNVRTLELCCNERASGWIVTSHPSAYAVTVTPSCICAELNALQGRHLVDNGMRYTPSLVKKLPSAGITGLIPCRYSDVILKYRGPKRACYIRARDELRKNGLQKYHWKIAAFVKTEKRPLGEYKAPRMIQHRSPEFTLLLAKYLKPFEHAYYTSEHNGMRFVTKGLNMTERAQLFKDKFELFSSPVFVLLDHSAFDASVRVEHLRWCHKQYLKALPSKTLRWLLSKQIHNRCQTPGGIRYEVEGTRMSGEFDTALGNTMLNTAAIKYVLCDIYFQLMVDGDDSVVIMEARDLQKFKDRFHFFERLGFKTKCEVVYNPHEVEYCQGRYVDAPVPFFCRDPRKILSNISICCRWYGKHTDRYLGGVALGELHLYSGVPVVSALLSQLLVKRPIFDEDIRYKLSLANTSIDTEASRVSFYETFGISPAEQVAMEQTSFTPSLNNRSRANYYSLPLACEVEYSG